MDHSPLFLNYKRNIQASLKHGNFQIVCFDSCRIFKVKYCTAW